MSCPVRSPGPARQSSLSPTKSLLLRPEPPPSNWIWRPSPLPLRNLSPPTFTMLVLMALLTTGMTGPLLGLSDHLRARHAFRTKHIWPRPQTRSLPCAGRHSPPAHLNDPPLSHYHKAFLALGRERYMTTSPGSARTHADSLPRCLPIFDLSNGAARIGFDQLNRVLKAARLPDTLIEAHRALVIVDVKAPSRFADPEELSALPVCINHDLLVCHNLKVLLKALTSPRSFGPSASSYSWRSMFGQVSRPTWSDK